MKANKILSCLLIFLILQGCSNGNKNENTKKHENTNKHIVKKMTLQEKTENVKEKIQELANKKDYQGAIDILSKNPDYFSVTEYDAISAYLFTKKDNLTGQDLTDKFVNLPENYNGLFSSEVNKFRLQAIQANKPFANETLKYKNYIIQLINSKKFGDYTVNSKFPANWENDKDLVALDFYYWALSYKSTGDMDSFYDSLRRIPDDYNETYANDIKNLKNKYAAEILELENKKDSQNSTDTQDNTDIQAVNKPEPSIGMTADEVRNSTWGKPMDINKTITVYDVDEQWVYKGDRYIYLEDGIVTAIQE
ncbi:MAG: hypothetical protein Q8934_14430 [Bacillota bacterium]|nr:hypothetical protein [Bacillota bacterium]